jgi:hypothetical protein
MLQVLLLCQAYQARQLVKMLLHVAFIAPVCPSSKAVASRVLLQPVLAFTGQLYSRNSLQGLHTSQVPDTASRCLG